MMQAWVGDFLAAVIACSTKIQLLMVPLHSVVSVQGFVKDLLTKQSSPCVNTEVMLLPFLIRNANLLQMLPARSVHALRATNKELYGLIHDYTSLVQLRYGSDITLLLSHSWPQLTTLKLSSAEMCERSVALLVQGGLTGLRALDLSRNVLQPPAVKQLAMGNWQLLACLNLEGSLSNMAPPAAEQSCQHLATSRWPALTALNISHNCLEATAIAELVQANWPKLRSLDVSGYDECEYDPVEYHSSGLMAQIAKSAWTGMQHLNLSFTKLGVDDARQLGQLRWLQLKRLVLRQCFECLDEDSCVLAMHHISAGMWPELQALDISDNSLSADSVAELVEGQWPALQNLDFSHSRWGFRLSEKILVQATSLLGDLNWAHITRLSLRYCFHSGTMYQRQDQAAVADAMRAFTAAHWPRLEALDVSNNQMDDAVMHQLTQHLSPSTTLVEINLGGNNLSYLSGLGSMSSLEHAPISHWQHIRNMDFQDTNMSPEEVELLLRSAPRSLHTLYVSCQVDQVTSARPSRERWPCNTILIMKVAGWSNLCDVLCSLSAGYWPVTALRLEQREVLSIEEVKEFVQWDLSLLQELCLGRLGIGYWDHMPEMARVLSCGDWPKLRTLDLSANFIDNRFVRVFIGGKWPLLEHLNLSGNDIGEGGLQQLSYANWPHLTHLILSRIQFNSDLGRDLHLAVDKQLAPLLQASWPGVAVDIK